MFLRYDLWSVNLSSALTNSFVVVIETFALEFRTQLRKRMTTEHPRQSDDCLGPGMTKMYLLTRSELLKESILCL